MNNRVSRERIVAGHGEPFDEIASGVTLRTFVSGAYGARNFYTGTATFQPGGALPFHTHQKSEAITVLEGSATVSVEGRTYRLTPFDCIHIPAFIPHSVRNDDPGSIMMAHSTFAEAQPTRTFSTRSFQVDDRGPANPKPADPESVRRFKQHDTYVLAEGTLFCDLFAKRFGALGICGGHGRFDPGSSLPCHVHQYDESITIVSGEALCQVEGHEYRLRDYDTAFIPEGRPHRFFNASEQTMSMIWVYAGDEPDRTLVEAGYCSGSLPWI